MSLIAHPLTMRLRNASRRIGLNSILGRLLGGSEYESRLADALRSAIEEGDTVWDIGANVGWYSLQFSRWAGRSGQVFAFEPDPQNAARLREAVAGSTNVVVLPIGLSNSTRDAWLLRGVDRLGATSKIAPDESAHENALVRVKLDSGDAVLESGRASLPDLVKIDVEGHELQVLQGMEEVLDHQRVRDLFIEIHFALLANQSASQVPRMIEDLLIAKGFTIRWVDQSHLHASR
jgi:FkbM family methyltransferase